MSFDSLKKALDGGDAAIAVIGLGYVGLPLAVALAGRYRVIGFDINPARVEELASGHDATREVDDEELRAATRLSLTADPARLVEASVYIITVPTPVDASRRPDLKPLISASRTVGQALSAGNVVIYESTVYPGCTEEDCVPVLEAESGLRAAIDSERSSEGFRVQGSGFRRPVQGREVGGEPEPETSTGKSFFVGYSPERINPGDKAHRLTDIRKVTAGSTAEAADFIDALYASIISAGTHKAPSIRVAEAAKVIENTQRDVNIALINELAMLFNRLGIDTADVLAASASKWNFLPFKPGLVGGHCIGVDPYYLTHKAQQIGFHPQMILAGRRTNDQMGQFVAGEVLRLMACAGVYTPGARVLVLGLTFKENCPDLRNTRVVDLVAALTQYNLEVDIHDPWADPQEARQTCGLDLIETPPQNTYAAIILAVAHREYTELDAPQLAQWTLPEAIIYDIKHVLPRDCVHGRL